MRRLIPLLGLILLAPLMAAAQGFAPVVQVNDKVVTEYEVDQRARFLTLLRSPGNPQEEALERLIDERLQAEVAEDLGIVLTPEQVAAGEEEFAGRANLSRDEFVQALEGGGVARETFRDFVAAGLLWREVVRQRFAPQVNITETDVDRAISAQAPRPAGLRVLFSEIILPANTPAAAAEAERRAAEISQYTSVEAFSRAARAFSASPSRDRGGRLEWIEVGNMAPGLAQIILGLAPGQVSPPIPIPNAIALFQLRAVEDGPQPPLADAQVSYAILYIPGGRSAEALEEVARIRARARNCSELYAEARRNPVRPVATRSGPISEVPADIALELAKLDENEISTALAQDGSLGVVMLCSRTIPLPEDVGRDEVRQQLQNQRLQALAENYLAELRADAMMRYP